MKKNKYPIPVEDETVCVPFEDIRRGDLVTGFGFVDYIEKKPNEKTGNLGWLVHFLTVNSNAGAETTLYYKWRTADEPEMWTLSHPGLYIKRAIDIRPHSEIFGV